MRNLIITFLIVLVLLPASLVAQTLYTPSTIDPEVYQDFVYLLKQGTGKDWQRKAFEKPSGAGIYLQLQQDPQFKTKESFRLQSNGKDQMVISSSSTEGLVFGFYKHLRNLGYSFYLPDELYSIIPKLEHPFGSRKNVVDKPFLQVREFFGTGGFGSPIPDPDKKVEKDWRRWKLRNGFGAAYHLAGHSGENFILENYDLLLKKSHWLAKPLTGDKHKDINTKLNYLDKEAVSFYINWAIRPLLQKGFELPPPNHVHYLSMEPSDGGGYINELPQYASRNLPSISDQVYGAANLAAKELDKHFPNHPNIRVNLYAYSSHAAPPSFPLHPRVFVQLVPYQFQNIAFGPSFIKLWAAKLKHFGLYDYFRYPDAQYDLPGGLSLGEAMKRLQHATRNGSEGVNYETSFSKFATGIPLWVMIRYMADGNAQWETNLQKLTKDLYGNASVKMLSLFDLFYKQPGFGPSQLGNAAQYLKEATALSSDRKVKQRLDEMKIYLHFARLVFESREANRGKLDQRNLPLAEYAWKLFPTKIIHSYRIMQLVSYAFLNSDPSDQDFKRYQQLHIEWFPETERSKTAWNRVPQILPDTEKNFEALLKAYKPSALPQAFPINELISLARVQGLQPKKKLIFGGGSTVRAFLGLYSDKPTVLHIKYNIKGSDPRVRISSIDENYLNDTAIMLNKSSGELRIPIAAGETSLFFYADDGSAYRLETTLSNGLYFFDGSPRGMMAFYKSFTAPYEQYTYDPDYYPSFFYIHPGIQSIDYKVQLNALSITSPAGRKIKSELLSSEHGGFENRRFMVAANEGGKIWKAEIAGNFNYNFNNIPDRYLLLEKK